MSLGYHMRIEINDCMLIGDVYRDSLGDLHAKNIACEIYIGERAVRLRALLDTDVAFIREHLVEAFEKDQLEHVDDEDYLEQWREFK